MKRVFKTEIAGFPIELHQQADRGGTARYSVRYGEQMDSHLHYATAATKLGEAIMHALTCEGKIN